MYQRALNVRGQYRVALCRCWCALCCQSALLVKQEEVTTSPLSAGTSEDQKKSSLREMVSHEETKCCVVPDSHPLTGPIRLAFLLSNSQTAAGVRLFKCPCSNPAPVIITSKITYSSCFSESLIAVCRHCHRTVQHQGQTILL